MIQPIAISHLEGEVLEEVLEESESSEINCPDLDEIDRDRRKARLIKVA